MKRFIAASFVAIALFGAGVAFGAVAFAGPRVSGSSGYLFGYDVKVGSSRACRDPWVWVNPDDGKSGTIECR